MNGGTQWKKRGWVKVFEGITKILVIAGYLDIEFHLKKVSQTETLPRLLET